MHLRGWCVGSRVEPGIGSGQELGDPRRPVLAVTGPVFDDLYEYYRRAVLLGTAPADPA